MFPKKKKKKNQEGRHKVTLVHGGSRPAWPLRARSSSIGDKFSFEETEFSAMYSSQSTRSSCAKLKVNGTQQLSSRMDHAFDDMACSFTPIQNQAHLFEKNLSFHKILNMKQERKLIEESRV